MGNLKIFNKLDRHIPTLVVDCILLYLINKNNNKFEYLDRYMNNKNNVFESQYTIFPILNNYLDMGHYMLLCYDLELNTYVMFLLGGSDGHASEYNTMKLNHYLGLDIKHRKKVLKNKQYTDDNIIKIMNNNMSTFKFLNYLY
jgi:hypothetical protein